MRVKMLKLKSFYVCLFCLTVFLQMTSCSQAQESNNFNLVPIAETLEYPWGMAFLPNGNILVTEREGQLRIIRDGVLDPAPITGLPENIFVAGQGGLLDVAIHPEFSENNLVYLSYAGRDENGLAGTEVARGRLESNTLTNLETIFTAEPKTRGTLHYGSRLLFLPDNTLLITIGERYSEMQEAQNAANHLGSVVRINDDGSIPEDNPFIDSETTQPEIFSYGHRNPQGLTISPDGTEIWLHEHGPKGGDEINIIEPGKNYGWPAITYGIDYSGTIISDQTAAPGMEQPLLHWTPSIAPSGMAFYTGNDFPEWQGDLLVGALVQRHLRRVNIENGEVVGQTRLLDGYARIRDVKQGPDGFLYILTDDLDGQLIRLEPK